MTPFVRTTLRSMGFSAAAFGALACTDRAERAERAQDNQGGKSVVRQVATASAFAKPVAVKCADGEQLETFSLIPVDGLSADQATKAIGWKGGVSFPTPTKAGVRLDVCFGSEGGSLRQIVRIARAGDAHEALAVGPSAKVAGLDDALFGDDTGLRVRVPMAGGRAFVIEGREIARAGELPISFAAAAVLEADGKTAEGSVIAGAVSYGNELPADESTGGCVAGTPAKSFVEAGDARIDFDICVHMGTSGGFAYDIARLTVTDRHTSLTEEQRAPQVLDTAAVAKSVQQLAHHHNACDSIRIELPHAIYALTASTMGDEPVCGKVLPDAPQLTDGAQSGAWRIRRGDAWTEGKGSFKHFVQDNVGK